jgi:hypothetical protein
MTKEVFTADPEEVKALLEYLQEVYQRLLTERAEAGQNVRYPDAFMAVHNFHKGVVFDLVKRTGATELYRIAADTFAEAMERELAKSRPLPTTERLGQALEALDDPKLAAMIERARQGYYDDYKSPLATPIIQLVNDIREAGHPEFAQRVIDGEFDATPEESKAWANSPEGQAVFQELLASPQGQAIYKVFFEPRKQNPEQRPKKESEAGNDDLA